MKLAQNIIILFICLLIAVLGFYYHFTWIQDSMKQFARFNVSFSVYGLSSMGSPFLFVFALVLVIPLYFIVNALVEIRNLGFALFYLGITYSFGALFWWIRLQYLIESVRNYKVGSGIRQNIAVNSLNLEVYTLVGFIVGAILSALLIKIIHRIFPAKINDHYDQDLLDKK